MSKKRLPSGWKVKKMWEVCDVRDGTHDSPKYQDNGYPLITSKNLKSDGLNFDKIKYISQTDYININKRSAVHKGDILFAMIGTIGNPIIVECETNFAIKNVALFKIPRNLSNYFLKYYFESEFVKTKMWQEAKGTTQKFVGLGYLRDFPVFLPPFPEQKRIVKILDEACGAIDKAKANAEKNLQNSRELFDTYLNKVFANPGKDWEEKTLGDVCEMVNRGISPKYIDDGLCVLNQKCIRDHRINFELSRCHDLQIKKVNSDKFIQIGDVLVNSTGVGTLGRVAQARELPVEAIVDSHITIVRPKKNMFYNEFFGYALIVIEKEIAKKGEGCGGQTELARNALKNDFKICYPKTQTEQQSIVAKFDNLSTQTKELITIYQQKLADLEELKKSILQKAFDGKL